MTEITVSAVVIRNSANQVLTVRKRGTQSLMLPGGKPENGESAAATATREVAEELGVELDTNQLELIGQFTAPAANERGHRVRATVFAYPYVEVSSTESEIEHLDWVESTTEIPNCATMLRKDIFPRIK